MIDMQVQNYFCISEAGIACRTENYSELKNAYSFESLLNEISEALIDDKRQPNIILRGMSYVYLYAYFFYLLHEIETLRAAGATYIRKYEKATAPSLLSFLSNGPPEHITRNFKHYKKEGPILDKAIPLVRFNLTRLGNYDLHADIIKNNTRKLDHHFSLLNAGVAPVIFRLIDYMDRERLRKQVYT